MRNNFFKAKIPSTTGYIKINNLHQSLTCGNSTIQFDGTKGAIVSFYGSFYFFFFYFFFFFVLFSFFFFLFCFLFGFFSSDFLRFPIVFFSSLFLLCQSLTCGHSTIQLDGKKGAIVSSSDGKNNWADTGFPLSRLTYRTFNESDYDFMMRYYGGNAGYSKINSTCVQKGCPNPTDSLYFPTMNELWWNQKECKGIVKSDFDQDVHSKYGAPQTNFLSFEILKTTKPNFISVKFELVIWDKTSTRLPEQMMIEFRPKKKLDWELDKLGSWVSPKNVILNGSQYQHAVWTGFRGLDHSSTFHVNTFDAPLVSPITSERPFFGWSGTPTVMPVPTTPLTDVTVTGMAINLFNNVWDTNYIFWYPYLENSDDGNIVFRYSIHAETK